MKMKKLLYPILTSLFLIFVISCSEDSVSLQKEGLNLEAYSQLKVQLKLDLNEFSKGFSMFTAQEKNSQALDIARIYFGENSKQFQAFYQSFFALHTSTNGRTNSDYSLTDYQNNQVNLIISKTEGLNNLSELKNYLNKEFEHYANADITIEDKNFILTFLSSFEVSFEFILENPEYFQETISNGRKQGFWGCVAGIAGGVAVTTAVVGALINPPLWVLVAADWYLVASAGAASITTIAAEC